MPHIWSLLPTIFFSDGVTYDPETEQYRKILGEVNREAAAMADYVYEVVCGIPICVKGEKRDFTDKNDKNNRSTDT